MCTLLIAFGVFEQSYLFAIDNRDEVLDRPAEEPRIHRHGNMDILAPRDLKAGGTWLGLNQCGVFAAITNRFRQASQPHHRSRGELVFRALEHPKGAQGAEVIAAVDPTDYAGFHLALADKEGVNLLWNDGQQIHHRRCGAGFYVLTERSFGAAPSLRLTGLEEKLAQIPAEPKLAKAAMAEWMVDHHSEDPLESTCVHMEEQNYGTRSSTIVELGDAWQFAHADGPPCSTAYHGYDEELQRLVKPG